MNTQETIKDFKEGLSDLTDVELIKVYATITVATAPLSDSVVNTLSDEDKSLVKGIVDALVAEGKKRGLFEGDNVIPQYKSLYDQAVKSYSATAAAEEFRNNPVLSKVGSSFWPKQKSSGFKTLLVIGIGVTVLIYAFATLDVLTNKK